MRTFVATKNEDKLTELRALFAGSALEIETFPAYADVEEGERSYGDNALLKARALQAQLRASGIAAAVLADDSGIEVDALAGRPGVLSARYADASTGWPERLRIMLEELQTADSERRGARFVCTIALIDADGREVVAYGTVSGRIAASPRGEHGFGYDPIFVDVRDGRTFAELSFADKNRISHRRKAADALLARLGNMRA